MGPFFRSIYLGWLLSLVYVVILYYSDKYKRESLINVGIAFTGGVAAIVLITLIHASIPGFAENGLRGGLLANTYRAFVRAAIPEEIAKLVVFFLLVWKFDFEDFSESFDGMLYMGLIGAGFGAYEDFSYIFSYTMPFLEGSGVGTTRALQFITWQRAFPGHVLINAVSGYFLGQARFVKKTKQRFLLITLGLAVAILAHGLFNLAASTGGTGWLIIYVIALGRVFFFLRKDLLEKSPYKIFSRLPKEIVEAQFVSLSNLVKNWDFSRSIDEYKVLYGESGEATIGYLPIVLSIVILYPIVISAVYYLNRGILQLFQLLK